MALTTDQKASKLFKKLQGTSETTTVKQFFEEAYLGRVSVFHQEQIWNQSDLIPLTAPVLIDAQIDGVVQFFQDKLLTVVPGLTNSYYHDDLKDTIPFNYSDGSYNYTVTDSTGTLIPFGMGDWLVDTEAGVLTFYSSVPANMPPMISFYKYVGTKGAGGTATGGAEIFVTDVTNAGDGIVGNKLYVPNTVPQNKVVTEAITDDDTVEIHFMVEGGLMYSPTVTVDGTNCTNLQQFPNDQRLFFGSVILPDIYVTRTVDLISSSGGTTSVIIDRAPAGPSIKVVRFANGYPGTQTEVKENDSYDIEIDFDPLGTEPTYLEIFDYGACKYSYIDLSGSGLNWGTVHTATVSSTIDFTSIVATLLTCRVRSHNSLGTWGNTMDSNDGGGNIDGTDVVLCNDIIPTFIDNGTTFPNSQLAFKNTENGSQDTTVNDFDTLIYSSPHGDFNISNINTYVQNKSITCTNPGDYNDSAINFQIDAYRNANDTNNAFIKIIEVADIAPLVTVTQPQTRLRTGPPSGVNYLITATSDQNMDIAPTMDINITVSGTWQGSGFVGGSKIFTRDINIVDSDVAGISAWTWAVQPTNNAGILANIIGDENVGGFISRVLTLAPFGTSVSMPAEVTNTANLSFTWSFKSGMVFQPIGTAAPVTNGWTIDATNSNPTEIIILDTAAANSSTQDSFITIEEIV